MQRDFLFRQWIAFCTLTIAQIKRIFRLWSQTVLPPVVTMTLYFLIFGHLIGSQLQSIQGYTYMQYITPGLLMMAVITNAYGHVTAVVFSARFQHSIEEIVVSSTTNLTYLLANLFGAVLRGLLSGILVFIVALFFTHLPIKHYLMVFLIASLASILLGLLAFINALYARRFDDIAIVPTFVLTPLTYLGGVFYSIHLLPSFWQKLSYFNPILYLINAFRYAFFGFSDVPVDITLLVIIICIVVLFWLCCHLLKKGVGLRS
ncbi:MAG: ABC transporter permease [Legionellales bacterium]|nr:ABC transporter permease [Legionellales bacterium]